MSTGIGFRPLGERVVVELAVAEDVLQTGGGVFIPATAITQESKEAETTGIVVAMGPGRFIDELGIYAPREVNEGDRVGFGPYAGSEIAVGNRKFKIMNLSELTRVFDA